MKRLKEGKIESVDGLYEFFSHNSRYYLPSASYDDYRTVEKHFFEDVSDYDGRCKLYVIAYDSGNMLHYLCDDYVKENSVLEDVYEILMDSGRYEYDEEGDTDLYMDGIFEIPLSTFITLDYFILEKNEYEEMKSFYNDKIPYSYDNYFDYAYDFISKVYNSNLKDFGCNIDLLTFIETGISRTSKYDFRNLELEDFFESVRDTDTISGIMDSGRSEKVFFKISPEKNNYFSKFMSELLREYIRDMY